MIVFYQVSIMAHSDCVSRFGSYITNQMLCATSSDADSCLTNPGGPLVVRSPDGSYTIAGIFSAAMKCSSHDNVGVFISVTAVHNWLADFNIV